MFFNVWWKKPATYGTFCFIVAWSLDHNQSFRGIGKLWKRNQAIIWANTITESKGTKRGEGSSETPKAQETQGTWEHWRPRKWQIPRILVIQEHPKTPTATFMIARCMIYLCDEQSQPSAGFCVFPRPKTGWSSSSGAQVWITWCRASQKSFGFQSNTVSV